MSLHMQTRPTATRRCGLAHLSRHQQAAASNVDNFTCTLAYHPRRHADLVIFAAGSMANAKKQGLNGADVDFETTWGILERAFQEIHTKNASALSFEELYRNAYKIVLKKKGEELYNKVAQFEENWLGNTVRVEIVRHLTALLMLAEGTSRTVNTQTERREAGEKFLKSLKGSWEDHQVCMGMLTDVLMYMVSCMETGVVAVVGL